MEPPTTPYCTNSEPRETKVTNNKLKRREGTDLDVVALADEAPGDEGVDAQAVEDPVRVVHLSADRSDGRHRAE